MITHSISHRALIYEHVKEHFCDEEELMKKSGFRDHKGHIREHNAMLETLTDMDQKIANNDWKQSDIQVFMEKWGRHIINSDMVFNAYQREKEIDLIE